MRLVVLQNIPVDSALRQQWNALVMQTAQPQVFYTYEWALAVERAYRDSLRPLLFLAYEEDRLLGVAALAEERGSISFLTANTGDYCDFLSLPENRTEFVRMTLEELKRHSFKKIVFTNLPADSGSVAAIRTVAAQIGFRCFARTAYICAQVSFQRLEKSKDGSLCAPGKKRLRRLEKAVAAEGDVTFEHLRCWDAVQPVLPEFLQAHVGRFLEIGRISNLADARRRLFLEELGPLLSQSRWMVMSRMKVGSQPVAWHLGFQFADNWFWYQPTFDSRLEKHWPGFCLLTQVIQDATENPALAKLDLGLGSEAYKAKFANESRETLYVTLHRSWARHFLAILRYRLAERVKTHPRLEDRIASLRHKFREVASVRRREKHGKSVAATVFRKLASAFWMHEEVIFFEWECREQERSSNPVLHLRPIVIRDLAHAAMEYPDEASKAYLLRSAKRLRQPGIEGFVLGQPQQSPLHFAWVAPFNGFYCAELGTTLQGEDRRVLLFDCWTPPGRRGRGYYGRAIQEIARQFQDRGNSPWIFSAKRNDASIQGLAKSGFRPRYSLVRRRILGWQWITNATRLSEVRSGEELSARV